MVPKLATIFFLVAATGAQAEVTNTLSAVTPTDATNAEAARILDSLLKEHLEKTPSATSAASSEFAARTPAATLTNDNLLPPRLAATNQVARREEFQAQLGNARQLRQQNAGIQAASQLIRLLEADAPEEFKQPALFELAAVAQQENQSARAQQIYAQYLHRYPEDPLVPEILLRQGILYREMGLKNLALTKFYAVLSSALSLKQDRFAFYQRLVLQAQTEIADTYYQDGKYEASVDYLGRLLKLDHPELNKARIQFKLIRSLSAMKRHLETAAQAQDFLKRFPAAEGEAEVRFLLAEAFKQTGRNGEALEQVQALLEVQEAKSASQPASWLYWQQRAGNEIANQFYKDGDYLNAVRIYQCLERLNPTPQWRCPVLYQIGLVFEHLKQPEKATAAYRQILACEKELAQPSPGLKIIFDMAQWRLEFLRWREHAEQTLPVNLPVRASAAGTTNSPARSPAHS